ncbi:MAG: extracellular solute-binding protein [Oscillospiraceae bacterium]|jgi:putative aldouronate transport system substrate-binding protein|nr:extracellular solute-binding protein [Oscillospiraceae bacterium]
MKKLLPIVLAAALALGAFMPMLAEATDPMAKYAETVKLTTAKSIGDSLQSFIDKKPDVLTDNIWFNDYRNLFNIDVAYSWTAPSAQYREKMNTQIAANDLPDFFQVDASQLKMLVEYGAAADLTDVFAKYASPFTNEMMEADMRVGLGQSTFGGKLMALPSVGGNRDGSVFWWIRYDWLEKLELKEPETFGEMLETLYAFTNNDPDGNGKDDTVGLGMVKEFITDTFGINALSEGLGAYITGWVGKDGAVEAGTIQPEVKKALETLAKLYADGVLDREFIVKDSSKVAEEVVSGKIGMFSGGHAQAFWPLQDAKNANLDSNWRAISIVSDNGEKPKTMLDGSASNFYAVNVDCEDPEAVVKLYNYYYAKDPALSPDFDFHYHGRLDADPESEITEYYNWAAIASWYPMQNLFIHRGVDSYFNDGDESALENYWIMDNINGNQKYMDGDTSYWSTFGWSGPSDYSGEGRIDYYDKNGMFIQNAYIGAATDSMTLYNVTLEQLRLETFTKIITGESSIDEFDNYIAQWKKLGGDTITQEVNDALK